MAKNHTHMLLTLVAATLATMLWSCSSPKAIPTQAVQPGRAGGSQLYRYLLLEAVSQECRGNFDAAFDLFHEALRADSTGHEAYYHLAPYYFDMNRDQQAEEMLLKATRLNPGNANYHERLAQGLIQNQDYSRAINAYEALYATNRSRTDVLDILRQLYIQQKDYPNALSTIERMEQVDGLSEETTLAKMQVYQLQKDTQAAYNALNHLVEEYPNDVNYKVMLGNWLQANERKDEALAMFREAESYDPSNEFVAESLYDYYHLEGIDSMANIYRDRILFNKYATTRTRLALVQQVVRESEQNGTDSTLVIDMFQQMIASDPENAEIAAFEVAYMQMKGMDDERQFPVLSHILDLEPDNNMVRLDMVRIRVKEQNWPALIELCRPGTEISPDELLFHYFLGLACFQLDDDDGALEAFSRGTQTLTANSNAHVASDFYAIIGDILHKKGDNAGAYAAYDSCLNWRPDNISCLNNYAYYLSEEERDLKRAEQMSRQTVEAEPDNATYLDTYAWILFLEERYAEAQVYILKAIDNLETEYNNSTIYDHAGDIHIVLGETLAALDFWQMAIDEGSDNADVIRKKIKRYAQ